MKSYSNDKFLILWGDEIFGIHTFLSRRRGSRDKRNIEPSSNRRPGSTTELCVIANCPLEVRALPLQQQKAPITLIINVLGAFLFVSGDTIGDTKIILSHFTEKCFYT